MEVIDRFSILRLAPACRLHWDESRHYHLLLYPAGAIALNRRAAAVLTRCDGRRAIDQIVRDLSGGGRSAEIEADVVRVLRNALEQGWVCPSELGLRSGG